MILNMAILVILLEFHMSTMNSVVCSRPLRGRTPCFIWDQMEAKCDSAASWWNGCWQSGDIICCGLQSLLNPPQNFGNHSPIGTTSQQPEWLC